MRENKVYTIVRVCSKLINHTTSTRDSCLNDLLLPTPDRFYSAQILKNLLILPNEVFFIKSFKRKKFLMAHAEVWLIPLLVGDKKYQIKTILMLVLLFR